MQRMVQNRFVPLHAAMLSGLTRGALMLHLCDGDPCTICATLDASERQADFMESVMGVEGFVERRRAVSASFVRGFCCGIWTMLCAAAMLATIYYAMKT